MFDADRKVNTACRKPFLAQKFRVRRFCKSIPGSCFSSVVKAVTKFLNFLISRDFEKEVLKIKVSFFLESDYKNLFCTGK